MAREFPEGQAMAVRLGHRTILSLPLLRGDEAIGSISLRRTEGRPNLGDLGIVDLDLVDGACRDRGDDEQNCR